jgi:hypothetical protein
LRRAPTGRNFRARTPIAQRKAPRTECFTLALLRSILAEEGRLWGDFVEKLGIARVRGRGFTLVFGGAGVKSMMGERRVRQEAQFYEFSLELPETHLLQSIDRFVELDGLRPELVPFYSEKVRPSIDPELMIRMLIVGYCFGIRSERRLCEEVHLNLAYRFGLDGDVPDHSTFSKMVNR